MLKCQYYQKSSIDSMQPRPRFQSHFYRSRKKNPKSYVELQKTSNSQSYPQEEQSRRHHTSVFKLYYKAVVYNVIGFPGGSDSKESICNAGDSGSIPGLGRSPGRGHGNSLQNSCLENPPGQRILAGYSP